MEEASQQEPDPSAPAPPDMEFLPLASALIRSSEDGILAFDRDLRCLVWNPAMERLTGLPATQAVGRDTRSLLPSLARNGGDRCLRAALAGESPVLEGGRSGGPANGRKDDLEIRCSPLRDAAGTIVGGLAVLREVAARGAGRRESPSPRKSPPVQFQTEAILNSITDGFCALDREWRFTYLNARAAALLPRMQRTEEALLGRSIWEEFPDLVGGPLHAAYHRAIAERIPVELEFYYPPLQEWFALRAYPSEEGLSIFFETITQRKGLERLREIQYAVAETLARAHPPKEMCRQILRVICERVGWRLCCLWQSDPEGQTLRCFEVWHREPSLEPFAEASRRIRLSHGEGLPGRIWASGEPAWVADVTRDANFPRIGPAREAGLHGAFGFPIRSESGVLGVMEFFSSEIEEPEEELLSMLAAIGSQVGQLIERMEAEAAARRSEALRAAILQSSLDAIITIDQHGRVLEWSPAAEEIFGFPRDRAVGREMAALIVPPDLREAHRRGFGRYLASEETRILGKRLELRAIRASGEEFPAELTVIRVPLEGPPLFAGFVRDITERKRQIEELETQREEAQTAHEELQTTNEELETQHEELAAANEELAIANEELRQQREELEALNQEVETIHRIGSGLAAELDLQKLLQAITDAATGISGAEFGSFFYNVVNQQGEAYMLYTLSGAPREAFERFPMPRNTKIFAPTFAGEGVVRSADITRDPRYGRNPPYYGMPEGHLPVRSYLAVPVVARSGEVLGGLFFGHSRAGVFGERQERMLVAIAAWAAIAIDNARLYEEAREARRLQERRASQAALVAEVGVALSELGDLTSTLHRCADALVRHLGAAFARIWTLNEAEAVLELRASAGLYTHLDGPHGRVPLGVYKIGRIAERAQPHLTNEIQGDPQISDPEWARREGMVAFAGYPLVAGGRVLGVMALFSREPLPDDTLATLAAVADVLAQGLERSRLERALQQRVSELAEADRRKDEFLAMLGHELRNPLAPALTALHVMRVRRPDEPGFQRSRDVAERQLQNMARIVDDLLDVSRITRGKIALRRSPIDLVGLVGRSVEALRPTFDQRQHRLVVALFPEPLRIDADATRIDQVLANLLSNAAKYTDPGGTIWVTLEREGEAAVIRVRDTGMGIAPDLLPRVFDLFVQADRSLDRAQGGLGIGLTLVKNLVQMHGGTVEARSEGAGRGSEFEIRLPLLRDG